MPVPHHPDLELMPSNDWVIPFALTDINGGPLDLTNASLQWILLDPDGNQVAIAPQITTDSPATAGTGAIAVNETVTTSLAPGRYTDSLRVSIANAVSTVWVGCILVDADPFAPPPPAPVPTQDQADPWFVVPPWWGQSQLPYANIAWWQWPYVNTSWW